MVIVFIKLKYMKIQEFRKSLDACSDNARKYIDILVLVQMGPCIETQCVIVFFFFAHELNISYAVLSIGV